MTQHRIFKLPMAALVKVLAENGAEEAAPTHRLCLEGNKEAKSLADLRRAKNLERYFLPPRAPQTAGGCGRNFLSELKSARE